MQSGSTGQQVVINRFDALIGMLTSDDLSLYFIRFIDLRDLTALLLTSRVINAPVQGLVNVICADPIKLLKEFEKMSVKNIAGFIREDKHVYANIVDSLNEQPDSPSLYACYALMTPDITDIDICKLYQAIKTLSENKTLRLERTLISLSIIAFALMGEFDKINQILKVREDIYVNLGHANVPGSSLDGDFTNSVNLSYANMQGIIFENTLNCIILQGANLSGANLRMGLGRWVNISEALLTDAKIPNLNYSSGEFFSKNDVINYKLQQRITQLLRLTQPIRVVEFFNQFTWRAYRLNQEEKYQVLYQVVQLESFNVHERMAIALNIDIFNAQHKLTPTFIDRLIYHCTFLIRIDGPTLLKYIINFIEHSKIEVLGYVHNKALYKHRHTDEEKIALLKYLRKHDIAEKDTTGLSFSSRFYAAVHPSSEQKQIDDAIDRIKENIRSEKILENIRERQRLREERKSNMAPFTFTQFNGGH